MKRITENEAFALAGDADCPVLAKEESEPLEAAVCLKRFPTGYVLGASDKSGELRIWFGTDEAELREKYDALVRLMHATGTPLDTGQSGPGAPLC